MRKIRNRQSAKIKGHTRASSWKIEIGFPERIQIIFTIFWLFFLDLRLIHNLQLFLAAQLVPSWNISISDTTTSSMTVQWSNFPLTSQSIQRLLVSYREHNSNVSLIFETQSYYNTHYTGKVLRSYRYYDVQVIAVASNSSNGTFSSRKEIARTNEGGKLIPFFRGCLSSLDENNLYLLLVIFLFLLPFSSQQCTIKCTLDKSAVPWGEGSMGSHTSRDG